MTRIISFIRKPRFFWATATEWCLYRRTNQSTLPNKKVTDTAYCKSKCSLDKEETWTGLQIFKSIFYQMRLPQPTKFMEKKLLNAMTISHLLVFVSRNLNEGNKIHLIRFRYYPGCQRLFMRGFRFRSVLKSEVREKRKAKSEKFFLAASPLVSSACGQRTKRSSPSHARKILWYPGYSGVLSLRNKTS